MKVRGTLGALAVWLAATTGSVAAPKFEVPPPVVVAPLAAGSAIQSVSFARAAFQLNEGQAWAYEGSIISCAIAPTAVKWRAADWELDTSRLRSVFREEFAQAGFSRASNINLFEENQADAERFQAAALITDMDGRFCGLGDAKPFRYNGRMRMTVEWQLYDTLRREVVRRIETTAGGEEKRFSFEGVEQTFFAAFRQNVRALLASEDFRAAVTGDTSVNASAPALTPITFQPEALSRRPIASSAEAVVAVFAGDGHGTGFLIAPEGYILTNRHVVGGAKFVKIRWPDRSETVGEVIRSDRRRDVALVKADAGGRKPLAIRSAGAGLGETVFAIGTPLDQKFQGTVTKGVVSASRTYDGLSFIQSDVTVNAGNSGGPLIDESGAVIGLTVSGYQVNGAPAGINLFIPIADALASLSLRPVS